MHGAPTRVDEEADLFRDSGWVCGDRCTQQRDGDRCELAVLLVTAGTQGAPDGDLLGSRPAGDDAPVLECTEEPAPLLRAAEAVDERAQSLGLQEWPRDHSDDRGTGSGSRRFIGDIGMQGYAIVLTARK